jgi:hypothetical protein
MAWAEDHDIRGGGGASALLMGGEKQAQGSA